MTDRPDRCTSTYLGVPCYKHDGHDGPHRGFERGRQERWAWTDDPNDALAVHPVNIDRPHDWDRR